LAFLSNGRTPEVQFPRRHLLRLSAPTGAARSIARLGTHRTGAKGRSQWVTWGPGRGCARAPRPIATGTCPIERALGRLVAKTPLELLDEPLLPQPPLVGVLPRERKGELPVGEAVQVVLVVVDQPL
jgi:hypothetical protein